MTERWRVTQPTVAGPRVAIPWFVLRVTLYECVCVHECAIWPSSASPSPSLRSVRLSLCSSLRSLTGQRAAASCRCVWLCDHTGTHTARATTHTTANEHHPRHTAAPDARRPHRPIAHRPTAVACFFGSPAGRLAAMADPAPPLSLKIPKVRLNKHDRCAQWMRAQLLSSRAVVAQTELRRRCACRCACRAAPSRLTFAKEQRAMRWSSTRSVSETDTRAAMLQ